MAWWRWCGERRCSAAEEFPGSFPLRARVPGVVDHAVGPLALVPRHSLGAEVVEAVHEPRRPWLAEGEAESGAMRSAACASMGARRAWDEEPAGVSDGVAVRPSCRTDGCSEDACYSFAAGPVVA